VSYRRNLITLGAMANYHTIARDLKDAAGGVLAVAARQMWGQTLRNTATVGGSLASGDVHSPISVALTALKARVKVFWQAGEMYFWQDLAKEIRLRGLKQKIITVITASLPAEEIGAAYEHVVRTPGDRPIVCAVSTACRVGIDQVLISIALGGVLRDLIVVRETVPEDELTDAVPEIIASLIGSRIPVASFIDNAQGSADYRRQVAPRLAERALQSAFAQIGISP
ncbi:MAG: hypothetical protein GYB68_16015, partial [Chloroflexi bacterium]|nr:hypothetical protein [Chloroflexota bacterium]